MPDFEVGESQAEYFGRVPPRTRPRTESQVQKDDPKDAAAKKGGEKEDPKDARIRRLEEQLTAESRSTVPIIAADFEPSQISELRQKPVLLSDSDLLRIKLGVCGEDEGRAFVLQEDETGAVYLVYCLKSGSEPTL